MTATSPYLNQPPRPLSRVTRRAKPLGAAMPAECWWNIWIDCDGRPCIETVYAAEAECLNEIAEQAEGCGWRGHQYGGTIYFKAGCAAWADLKDEALLAMERRAEADRADRIHEWSGRGIPR